MNEEQSAALASNVADWLKDHQYTQLVKTDAVEVWRCKAPGNTNLAFDITITRFGMGVMGDIGGLTFSVGSNYGVQWIANTSMGNLHGKLESHCKQTWIDKEEILDNVRACICEALEEDGTEHPDTLSTVEGMVAWLRIQSGESFDGQMSEWLELLEHIDRFEDNSARDVVPAFDLIAESEKLLRTSDTWEWSFDKPTDHVWRKLHYVQYAAKKILAQLAAAEEADAPQVEGVDPRTPQEQLKEIVGQLERYGYVQPQVLPLLWAATNLNDAVWRSQALDTSLAHIAAVLAPLRTPDVVPDQPAATSVTEHAYATAHESEQWWSDSLASFISDHEIAAGTEIFRGVIDRPRASSFMVEADDVINHMANQAYDNNSEYADNFPDLKPEQEEELKGLLVPLQEWADKSCDVNFYTVEQIEPYIVTPDDVDAAGAYLKAQTEGAQA